MHDLMVIGAGPVGSFLASLCSKSMEVAVLEEHKEAGNKPCSGLVSDRLKKILPREVIDSPGLIQHEVKGAKIHIMDDVIELGKRGTAAYIIDRDVLDKRLAQHAASSGCEMMFGDAAKTISVLHDRVRINSEKRSYESKILAGCDGARSVVARHINSAPQELLNGLIAIEKKENRSDQVEMWFDRRLVSDGFFWAIPRGSETEYGAMGSGINFSHLEKFFGLARNGIAEKSAAPIPMGIVKTISERILLVGDSACQTKPWSGGGITYGMLSAKVASRVLIKAVEKDDLGKEDFSEYENGWKKLLIKDITCGMVLRELFKDLEGGMMGGVLKYLPLLKAAGESIDFDFPFSSLLSDVLKK